jgi:hypothetical protein
MAYKPGFHYHADSRWVISAGYKYIDRYQGADEHDPWQEITLNRKFHDLVIGYQVRLEERIIDDVDGVLPRLRLLAHMSHPLGESPFYLTGSEEFRVNVDNKGEGPVSGFEQNRLSLSLGRHIGDHIQFEAGYLWQYKLERAGDDKSNHAIHLFVVVNTKAKRVKKPAHRDRYR